KATINYSPQNLALTEVSGRYYKTDPATGERIKKNGVDETVPFRTKARLTRRFEEKIVSNPVFEVKELNPMLLNVMWGVLPFIIIAAFIYFVFIRQIKMAGKGALSFGKSKAR